MTTIPEKIIKLLRSYPGNIFTKRMIFEKCWELMYDESCDNTIYVNVHIARRILNDGYILSVRFKGYKWVDTIYTLGHKETYRNAFLNLTQGKHLYKLGKYKGYPGGSVFKDEKSAQAYVDKYKNDDYAVFGVLADWETETEPDPDHEFNNLLVNAPLIELDEGHDV